MTQREVTEKERKTDQDEVEEEERETRDPKTTLFMSNKGVSDSLLLWLETTKGKCCLTVYYLLSLLSLHFKVQTRKSIASCELIFTENKLTSYTGGPRYLLTWYLRFWLFTTLKEGKIGDNEGININLKIQKPLLTFPKPNLFITQFRGNDDGNLYYYF